MAVRHAGDVQMPPKGKLKDEQIAALERWVKIGCSLAGRRSASPETNGRTRSENIGPFNRSAMPAPRPFRTAIGVARRSTGLSSRGLNAGSFAPSPRADRRTLIRRVSYDLTGLPPSPADVEAFVRDPDPAGVHEAGRPPARLAPIRRTVGAALARPGPLFRHEGLRLRPRGAVLGARGPVSRLGRAGLQRRPAV